MHKRTLLDVSVVDGPFWFERMSFRLFSGGLQGLPRISADYASTTRLACSAPVPRSSPEAQTLTFLSFFLSSPQGG